jgi:hypothetical protein
MVKNLFILQIIVIVSFFIFIFKQELGLVSPTYNGSLQSNIIPCVIDIDPIIPGCQG